MRKTAHRHFLVPHFILVVEQKHLYMSYSHHVFDSWEANKTQSQPIWNAISDPIIKIHFDPFPMGNLNSWPASCYHPHLRLLRSYFGGECTAASISQCLLGACPAGRLPTSWPRCLAEVGVARTWGMPRWDLVNGSKDRLMMVNAPQFWPSIGKIIMNQQI